ncbi:MAG: nucleoside kinase, partial [Clostridia bacterium]|nr:nucleoside kinase [Clostridia bacterium]
MDNYLYAKKCEEKYEKGLEEVVNKINENKKILIIFVSGPSCSGKTTTTKKLCESLEKSGRTAYTVSLDDFYLDTKDTPLDENGEKDFETLYSLDLEFLFDFLERLCAGKPVYAPRFDFVKKRRDNTYTKIDMEDGDVCIVEGLHGLNPIITLQHTDNERVFRLYLEPQDNERFDIPSADVRLIRRLVRDHRYRGTDADGTLDMWKSVRKGEEKWIYPFKDTADATIRTGFEYETGVLKKRAFEVLGEIKEDSEHYETAKRLLAKVEKAEEIDYDAVPE